ncbi:MAG TPA: hypothetical protein DCE41_33815 [Cytophagales bacterium]|nr:hypothetical protein [Cytophagales bacterium]HAA24272.1 hypothetical protein [Cytophagales bacterium]HAP59400.1 hypothetical protein [Cytophagales bacterium]
MHLLLVKIIYLANVVVAGWISITSLFAPQLAQRTVFSNDFAYSEAIRLVGALWGAIFLLSVLGLFYPEQMRLVFLFQLLYKSSWLLFAVLPAISKGLPYPKGMAAFFVVWVILLPWVIPWKSLFLS